ncbi:MAG: hypothetical protein ACI828_000205 [Flavobacteriales bacterium]|jgi:hypothetical protein
MKTSKFLALLLTGALFFTCSSDEKTVDNVISDTEIGAVLRTIEIIDNSIPIAIENGQTQTAEGAQLSMIIEEQDVKNGDLLESVDVYITFKDGSPLTGDSSNAITEEVFVKNIPAGEFSDGPFGLPRATVTITALDMLSKVNLTPESLFGGDTFTTRFALNLTDGRIFSSDNAGGIITGGFFSSPFQYRTPVVCNLETTAFVGDYLLEEITPYVDGPTFDDGSVVTVEIGDTDTERFFLTSNYPDYCSTPNDFRFLFVCGEIVIPTQESNCACGNGADFFGASDSPANYDATDDSVLFISFLNDTLSDCGPPVITTYKLTKQ